MQIILQTPRLILRQFTDADAPLILQLNSDPDVVKYVMSPYGKQKKKQKKFLSILFYRNTGIISAGGPFIQKIILNL